MILSNTFREALRMIKILLTLALLIFSTTASSWEGRAMIDGTQLWEMCEPEDDPIPASFCYGYLLGVHDRGRYESVEVCIPDGATLNESVDLTRNYLRDNPELHHRAADWLVATSWYEEWPCPE